MPVYDPEFLDEKAISLYEKFGVAQNERLVVRFLTMLNAGFLPVLKICEAAK